MALLVAGCAVCRLYSRTVGDMVQLERSGKFLHRAYVPKSHYAIGESCTSRADEQADIHQAGHDPRDVSGRLRGHGPDRR
jgi:hypothetical protein